MHQTGTRPVASFELLPAKRQRRAEQQPHQAAAIQACRKTLAACSANDLETVPLFVALISHPDDPVIDEMLWAVAYGAARRSTARANVKRRHSEPSCAVQRAICTAKRAAPQDPAEVVRIVLRAMPRNPNNLATDYMEKLGGISDPGNGVVLQTPHLRTLLRLLVGPAVPSSVLVVPRLETEPREALRALFGRLVHGTGPLLAVLFFGHVMGYHAGPVAERFSGAVIGAAMVSAPRAPSGWSGYCSHRAMCAALHRGILYTVLGHSAVGSLGPPFIPGGYQLSGLSITNAYKLFVDRTDPVATAYARGLGARATQSGWMCIRLRSPKLVTAFFGRFYPARLWPDDMWNWQQALVGPTSGEGSVAQRLRHADEQLALGGLTPAEAVALVLQ